MIPLFHRGKTALTEDRGGCASLLIAFVALTCAVTALVVVLWRLGQ